MEDSQIIELYWKKNPDAIAESSRKYGAYCLRISQNILHSNEDAEECLNDTWLHAWNYCSRTDLFADCTDHFFIILISHCRK